MKADKVVIPMAKLFFYGLLGNSKWNSLPKMALENSLPSPPHFGIHIVNLFSWQRFGRYDTKSTHNKYKYKWYYIKGSQTYLASYLLSQKQIENMSFPPHPTLFMPTESPLSSPPCTLPQRLLWSSFHPPVLFQGSPS